MTRMPAKPRGCPAVGAGFKHHYQLAWLDLNTEAEQALNEAWNEDTFGHFRSAQNRYHRRRILEGDAGGTQPRVVRHPLAIHLEIPDGRQVGDREPQEEYLC